MQTEQRRWAGTSPQAGGNEAVREGDGQEQSVVEAEGLDQLRGNENGTNADTCAPNVSQERGSCAGPVSVIYESVCLKTCLLQAETHLGRL